MKNLPVYHELNIVFIYLLLQPFWHKTRHISEIYQNFLTTQNLSDGLLFLPLVNQHVGRFAIGLFRILKEILNLVL